VPTLGKAVAATTAVAAGAAREADDVGVGGVGPLVTCVGRAVVPSSDPSGRNRATAATATSAATAPRMTGSDRDITLQTQAGYYSECSRLPAGSRNPEE
jgi:hypothetical protein